MEKMTKEELKEMLTECAADSMIAGAFYFFQSQLMIRAADEHVHARGCDPEECTNALRDLIETINLGDMLMKAFIENPATNLFVEVFTKEFQDKVPQVVGSTTDRLAELANGGEERLRHIGDIEKVIHERLNQIQGSKSSFYN